MPKRTRDDPLQTLIAETVAAVGLSEIGGKAGFSYAMPKARKNKGLMEMLAMVALSDILRDHAMRQPASAFTEPYQDPFHIEEKSIVNAR